MKNDALELFIRDRWKALEITQAEFARRMEKHDSYIEQVRTGDKTFPIDAIDAWMQCLQLTIEKGLEFTALCRSANEGTHRNAWIKDLEARTKEQAARIESQDKQIADLTKKYQALVERVKTLMAVKHNR